MKDDSDSADSANCPFPAWNFLSADVSKVDTAAGSSPGPGQCRQLVPSMESRGATGEASSWKRKVKAGVLRMTGISSLRAGLPSKF